MVVESLDAKGKVAAFGSGVVIAPGQVITNRHVIEEGVSFRVEHGGKKWTAKLVRVDPDHDLAELAVAGLNAPAVTVRDSSKLAVGEKVYAIGAPEGLELTISEGLISGLRDFDKGRVIQTSAAISPGSSGGGLFDAQGRLVGITTFYLKEGQSLNFALPAEWTLALNRQPASTAPPATESSPAFQALVWLEVAYEEYQAGKYGAALYACRQAIRLKPDDANAWDGLGAAYRHLGQYDKAISAGEEAIRLEPDDEHAWDNLGFTYIRLEQYDKAISAEKEALRLKPDDGDAWVNLGVAYLRLRQYDKAISAEKEAFRLKPDDEAASVNVTAALVGLGQYDKAILLSQELLRIEPNWEGLWVSLGAAFAGLGQYGKAITAYREAVRLSPNDANSWYGLGLAYKADGQQSEVIKVYEKLKTLDPKLADKFFKAAVLP